MFSNLGLIQRKIDQQNFDLLYAFKLKLLDFEYFGAPTNLCVTRFKIKYPHTNLENEKEQT